MVQLDSGAPALVKAGSSGILPVGAINSYLTIDAGPQRIVAVITAIRITEDRGRRDEPIDDTSAARFVEATLIGRFDGGRFTPGLAAFPSLFAPVAAASPTEIDRIFRPTEEFRLRLGDAVVAPEQDVLLDPDALLTRHFAVLGSTGSGKSCTVSAILEGLAELNTPNASVLIFDANGEYSQVASLSSPPWKSIRLGISEDGSDAKLVAPHWLMNMREHVELFGASQGVQEPLLHRAVLESKLQRNDDTTLVHRLDLISQTLRDIREIASSNRPIQHQLITQLTALEQRLAKWQTEEAAPAIFENALHSIADWKKLTLVAEGPDGKINWDKLTITQAGGLDKILTEAEFHVRQALIELGVADISEGNADSPSYYSLSDLLTRDLPRVISAEMADDSRVRSFASPLLLRIARLLSDERYAFIAHVPPIEFGLESYLRLLFGQWAPMTKEMPWTIPGKADILSQRYQAVILDLSEISTDVLTVVTSLIGRLILEFSQRCRPRSRYPILLVLEEAHRYIPSQRSDDIPFGRVNVFERIAKEGRKFGVSLCVASQRPSELSRTVISQCGTLIVHRIVNPEDQDLIRFASPVASRDVLRQLPSLAKQHAIVLGEAVPAPTYVRVRDVDCPPHSSDPSFTGAWSVTPEPADAEDLVRTAAIWSSVRPVEPSPEDDW
ncbi:MAG TPA: ATP-binding protein [Candidatus Elarobacter sp.]|nr:ATP-binding protein [Candidatus Elarobacter sp.]